MRLPVAAAIALTSAPAASAVLGSPMPPGSSALGTMWVSTAGASFIRSTLQSLKWRCTTRPFWIVISPFNAALKPHVSVRSGSDQLGENRLCIQAMTEVVGVIQAISREVVWILRATRLLHRPVTSASTTSSPVSSARAARYSSNREGTTQVHSGVGSIGETRTNST